MGTIVLRKVAKRCDRSLWGWSRDSCLSSCHSSRHPAEALGVLLDQFDQETVFELWIQTHAGSSMSMLCNGPQCYKAIAYFFVNEGAKPEWIRWHEDYLFPNSSITSTNGVEPN